MAPQIIDYNLELAARMLTAMANPNRLRILYLIADDERSVTQLSETVGLAQSPLSQHLAKLRELEIVSTRRAGQSVLYSLRSPEIGMLLDRLNALYHIRPT